MTQNQGNIIKNVSLILMNTTFKNVSLILMNTTFKNVYKITI